MLSESSVGMQVNGYTRVISKVYYILELKNNVLSIGQLQDKGMSILIQHGNLLYIIQQKD